MKPSVLILLVSSLLGGIPPAAATPFTSTATRTLNGTLTGVQIQGTRRVPDEYQATYTNAAGAVVTTSRTATGLGTAFIGIVGAKDGTTITVTNLTESITNPAIVASTFSPPSNIVVSDFEINSGSVLTLAGSTFTLSGGFTAVQTAVNYDPTSPSYGIELGFIADASITGTGVAGTFQFGLVGNTSTETHLASVWEQVLLDGFPVGGVSTEQDFEFAGILMFGTVPTPFSGFFDGTATFFADGSTTAQGTLNLTTSFGPASGPISASAVPQVVPTPGIGTFALILLGLLVGMSRSLLNLRTE